MPGLDLTEMYLRVAAAFVVGNSDMHLKNFSLIENMPGSRIFQLSKAYDMLPVNVIMPEDKEQMALTINGKKRNIHKKEFRKLAESYEISPKVAENVLKKICRMENKFLDQVEGAYLSKEQKEQVSQLVHERIKTLSL